MQDGMYVYSARLATVLQGASGLPVGKYKSGFTQVFSRCCMGAKQVPVPQQQAFEHAFSRSPHRQTAVLTWELNPLRTCQVLPRELESATNLL